MTLIAVPGDGCHPLGVQVHLAQGVILGIGHIEPVFPKRQPLRVILDRTLQTPPDVPVVSAPGHCLLVAGEQHPGRQNALESAGAEVMLLPASGSGIDLQQLLIELNRRECNEVLVECGATLAGAFVREGLFDELIVFMAPALLGSSARPLLGLPQLASMSEKVSLKWQDVRRIGDDLRLTLTPV